MLTSRALRCSDDFGSLLLFEKLDGVGPAIASAMLTAFDPCTYTVLDVNSVAAVQDARYLSAVNVNDERLWLPYLCGMRDIARRCGTTPRDTDRALFIAGKGVVAQ